MLDQNGQLSMDSRFRGNDVDSAYAGYFLPAVAFHWFRKAMRLAGAR
jgi:hypothetical protein